MIIVPAVRGFLGASRQLISFATLAPVAPGTNTFVPCTIGTLPGGTGYLEWVSGGSSSSLGGGNGGLFTSQTGFTSALNITSHQAGVSGDTYSPPTHNATYVVTVRLRAAAGGAILGTFTFSVTSN
jgi:hypothetical protein